MLLNVYQGMNLSFLASSVVIFDINPRNVAKMLMKYN